MGMSEPDAGMPGFLSEEPGERKDLSLLRGSMTPDDANHLDSTTTSAFVEGHLTGAARDRAAAHLAVCASCRDEIVAVREVLTGISTRPMWRRPPVLLAAAAVVALVAIGLPLLQDGRLRAPVPVAVRTPERETRDLSAASPAPDAIVERGPTAQPLVLAWHGAEAGSRYRVNLLDANGETLWSSETGDTSITVPGDIELLPGGSYFWFVDALGTDGRSLTTGALRFSIR